MTTATPLPVLFGLAELVELFPSVNPGTVYRWNTIRDGRRQLPPPAYVFAAASVWTEDQVREFASGKRLELDAAALEYIRKQQLERFAGLSA